MFYLYVLYSKKVDQLYIGYLSNLKRRLEEYNSRKSFSTKSKVPWEIFYYESYKSEIDAKKREEMLKIRGQARYQLLKRIKESIRKCQT